MKSLGVEIFAMFTIRYPERVKKIATPEPLKKPVNHQAAAITTLGAIDE